MKDHKDITVTRADKGNKTVVLTKRMYINESNKLLNDVNTHSVINFNPLNKVLASLKKFCTKLLNNNHIEKNIHSYIYQTFGNILILYLLPKLHKNPIFQTNSFNNQLTKLLF